MATEVLDDAFVSINGVDLSDHVKQVTLNYSADDIEDTNMGDDTHIHMGGLKQWSIDVEFAQDYAASKVDATLFSLVGASAVPLIVRKDKTAGVGTTNPNYTGNGVLLDYNPLGGSVGELHTTSATFQSAGTLSRATS